MIQKSYEKSEYGKLYLIPTPIGNLDDITIRGINTLKEVDIIFAEDTRQTLNLLKYLNISKKVESCHKFSEMMHKDKIISILKSGKNVGYVTDRGTPLISDPGNVIVDYAIKENITVIALPGASALLPALNMSGISNEKFLFYGFLDSKASIAKKELIDLKEVKQTLIFFMLPLSLAIIHTIFGLKFCTWILNSMGVKDILDGSVITFAFLILIYGIYFIITYICSKNIIKDR